MDSTREVRDALLGVYLKWSAGDRGAVDIFSVDPNVLVIGTDPREWWEGPGTVRPLLQEQTDELKGIRVAPGRLRVHAEGNLGWIADDPTFILTDGRILPLRVTAVFRKERDGWKVLQWHASVGAVNTEAWGREFTTSLDIVAELVDRERPNLAPIASREGTVTIMFTDIESSTATNERLGDDRFLPLLLRHNELIEAQTRSAGGTVVKAQGDGFMLAFPSARRAVDCAVAIQRDAAKLSKTIKIRMGIHTGEPLRRSGDFFGRDVAFAARLGAAAIGGEILISSTVKSLIEPSRSFRLDGPRKLKLKGFEGKQTSFSVGWVGGA